MAKKSRLYKVVHRGAAGSMLAVAAVSGLMGNDLSPILGADAAAKVLAGAAFLIAGLELLPALDAWMAPDAEDDDDHPVDVAR